MNFLKTLGLGVYYRLRRISKAVKNWKKFGVVIFGALFLATSMVPGATLQAQAASTDVLRVTIPVGQATITVGQTEDYTIVNNVKLNGVAVQPDTVKWYVDTAEQTSFRNQQNFVYTPTVANENPGYLIRVIVTKGSLTANSSSRLYVKEGASQNTLNIAISPAGTQTVQVGGTMQFTPSVQWNGGAAQAGTQVDWYVNSIKKTTLVYTQAYSLPTATAGVYSVYAVARYNSVTSGHSNSTLVNVQSTPPQNDVLRVTIPVGAATIKLGQTEDYTIVHNVKLNGIETQPDSVKWYVDGSLKSTYNNQQNFAYTPTAVNTKPGYLIKVVVTKGTLSAESTSRLYVQDADNNLVISITPVGTKIAQPDEMVEFIPAVQWNSSNAPVGTLVDWYVDGSLAYQSMPYRVVTSFSRAFEVGVHTIYAVARYNGVTSGHSNSSLIQVNGTQNQPLSVNILEQPQTLVLQNGMASRQFTFAAYHGQNAYTPAQKLWTVTGGGVIDPATGLYTATSVANFVTVKIQVWDEQGQTVTDTLTFNVTQETQNVKYLASVTLVPAVYGPVLSGSPVPYTAYGWDQYGAEIQNISFNWMYVNQQVGTLTATQTGYHQSTTLNTFSTVVTGTYSPLYAMGHYTDANGGVWNVPSQVAQLMLTQLVTQDVMTSVSAWANPASIYVGGDISTLTAQAYGNTGPLNSGVSYTWTKISGPSNFVSVAYGQSVQIISDTTAGTAVYRVTASYTGDTSVKTADVSVSINPRTNHTLTVNITPDPVYGSTNTNQPAWATVLYDGVDVTSMSFIDWTMLNSTAGYIYQENQASVTVRTGNTLGNFGSALQVYATYSGLSAYDTATVVVSNQTPPTYWLNWTLNGVIEDGSTPSEGDVIVYTLTLTNNQTTTLNNVWTSVDVPTYTAFLSATSAVDHPGIYGRTISWNAGTFVPGASKVMTFRVTINNHLSKKGVSITAYGKVTANEITGFNVQSNTIRVAGSGAPVNPNEPLPSTGAETWILGLLALLSLGLATLAYRWMARRAVRMN